MITIKQAVSFLLVLLLTFGNTFSFQIGAVGITDTIPQTESTPLPSSVTLVGSRHLPPIANQGAVGCCASMAATYMQFTNAYSRYLHSLNPNTDFNPSSGLPQYNFSPRFTYNLAGSGTAWVYEVLKEQGTVLQTYSVFSGGVTGYASDNALANDWATISGYWSEAMNYRISDYDQVWMSSYDFQLTTTDEGNALLQRIKTALYNGNVVVTGGYPSRWDYTTVQNGGSIGTAGEQVIYRSTNRSSGGHQVSIVGYDDNLTCTVNGVTLKGAFLVANSWGTSWVNDGYTWIMYDAVNQLSAYAALNHTDRQWTLDQFVFLDWQTDLLPQRPALTAQIEITTADRNGFSVTLTRTDTNGNTESYTPYIIRNENLMPKYNTGLNFYGNTGSATGYLTFNFSSLLDIPQGTAYSDYIWGITVTADSGKSLTVGKIDLLNENGTAVYTVNSDKTITSGETEEYLFSDLAIVTFDTPEGAILETEADSSLCEKGTQYSFSVFAQNGYSAEELRVSANGVAVYPLDGVYTITVNENTHIQISGVTPASDTAFDTYWYGSGFENWSGKFLLLLMVNNSYLDPDIYASENMLNNGIYPYYFRITVEGTSYCFTPHSFYRFSGSTLYRLPIVDQGWIPENGKTYTLKIEVCTDSDVLYSATESVTCSVDIEQSYTDHTHSFDSGKYTAVHTSDCSHQGYYDEFCSFDGCQAVTRLYTEKDTTLHTAFYSDTVAPTIYSKGSYTVRCSHCQTVVQKDILPAIYPESYDIDHSGSINVSDVNTMLVYLATTKEAPTDAEKAIYDLDTDGFVSVSDLNTLLTYLALSE